MRPSSPTGEPHLTDSGRDLSVLGATLLALGLGEELWQSYLPAYITALGGTAAAVGVFASCRDLLDGLYQLPGGWFADRYGARRAVTVFTVCALAGYAAYALAWRWPVVLIGLAGAMAWKAGAFPATFSLIGDRLPRGARVSGFTVQSLAVRAPRVVSAPLGGLLVWHLGLVAGLRTAMGASVVLALGAVVAQHVWFPRTRVDARPSRARLKVLTPLPPALIRLLVADCFVRIGEAVAASFIVLYVTSIRHLPLPWFGALYGMQQLVALASYLPAARAVTAVGPRALVAVSFTCFALFPLAVLAAPGLSGLVVAFVVGGLKEFGEPARKASIVDGCRADARAREVGLYYTVRNLLVVPAGIVGGLLWQQSPGLALAVAGITSAAGLVVFGVTSCARATQSRLGA